MNEKLRLQEEENNDNFCKRLTTCELCLIALVCALTIGFGYFYVTTPRHTSESPCLNKACMESAVELLDLIDPSISPCDDFFDFICGNFLNDPNTVDFQSLLTVQIKDYKNRLQHLITSPIEDSDIAPVVLQKQFYNACMNVEEIDNNQDEIFWNLINDIGGWPLILGQHYEEHDFHWLNAMVKLRKLGLPFEWFLEFAIHRTSEGSYLKISVPSPCPKIENYSSYFHLMVEVATNMSVSHATAYREFRKVADFEDNLSQICLNYQGNEVEIGTIADLKKLFPKIDWVNFTNHLGNGDFTGDTEIAYNIHGYIQELDLLFIKTGKKIQANFIVWKMIEYFSQYLTEPLRENFENYANINIDGIEEDSDEESSSREDFCVRDVALRFRGVSDLALNLQLVTPEAREDFNNMVTFIKEELVHFFSNVDWEDEDDKSNLIEWLESAEIVPAMPNEIYDNEEKLADFLFLGDLEFQKNESHPIQMIIAKEKARTEMIFNVVSAGNDTLILPENYSVILGPLFYGYTYNQDRPNYLNYAGLGQGIVSTLMEKFGKYWNHSSCAMENNTYVEDIRNQLIDFDVSYGAYLKWVAQTGEEDSLTFELSDYNPKKLFWLKGGTLMCDHEVDKKEAINDIMKNSKYFSEVFECSADNNMVNAEKCEYL